MELTMLGIIGIVVLFLFLALRMPVGIAMGLVGFLGCSYAINLEAGFGLLQTVPFRTSSSYVMCVLPFFVLMAELAASTDISREMYYSIHKWMGHLPGGLAMATIVACAFFSTICGSSPITAATLAPVAVPEMDRYGYDRKLSTGCVAAGGTLGILIPPSLIFIIYGVLTEQSVGKLFMAGFIPGFILAGFFIITIYILVLRNPKLGPEAPQASLREKATTLRYLAPLLCVALLVLGGIYLGWFTPTEAGAVGAFGILVISLSRRQLTWRKFGVSIVNVGRITGMGLMIIIGAMIFGYFMTVTRLPMNMADFIIGLGLSPLITVILILILYIVLGCFMEALAMVTLTVPIFFPVIMTLGFDPIWFGVIVVIMVELGQITPPVGMNVYIISGVLKDVPMTTIFRGIVPFLLPLLLITALLLAFPQIALFLPGTM